MPTLCIQCAMKAMVAGEPYPVFDEEPAEHARRYHPNPLDTYRERQMLEAAVSELLNKGPATK